MRCELSEKLIPLYVGGDLEPDESDDLRLHLESCETCNRLAEDFQSSRDWMTIASLPEFDEASFANLRASVLSRIEHQQPSSSWFNWLMPKWNPQFVLASSVAALVVMTGIALAVYLSQSPTSKPGEDVAVERGISTATGRQRVTPHSVQPAIKNVVPGSQSSRRSNRVKVETSSLPPEAFQNDPFGQPLEEPQQIDDSANLAEAAPTEQTEKEMLRIELQTADPNIRIIWFAPKSDSTSSKTK